MSVCLILKNAQIFDGMNQGLIRNQDLVIENGKIKEIRHPIESVGDAQIIDLKGCTVLPGFIDCHMHMLLEEVPKDKESSLTMKTPDGEIYPNADTAVAYRSVKNCRKMLQAGFTTVMDGGGRNFVECALREAIQKDIVEGPNLLIAGKQLTTNHAHFIGFSMEPYGPYGMRKAVRDLMWWSVDFLKLQLSPPIRLVGRNSNAVDFTFEEVQAAVDEAHNYGVPVHAHLRGPDAIKNFLKAGGDYVVHGTGIDEEGIEMMVKEDKILLPTLLSPTPTPSQELLENKTRPVLELLEQTAIRQWESVKKAYRAGIRLAFSTDMGTLGNHIGENSLEFLNLQKIGMSPYEALCAATSIAAEVTGRQNRIGKIVPGFDADLVAVKGNPLENLEATSKVQMTIKNGKIVYKADND